MGSTEKASGSRFSYATLNEDPLPAAPEAKRGKDGHLVLSAKGSGDFFGGAASPDMKRNNSIDNRRSTFESKNVVGNAMTGTAAGRAPPVAAAGTDEAQKKFGNAKAISSKDFQDNQRER